MEYPRDFSPQSRAYVEAERLRATRDYEQTRDELPSGYGHMSENVENLRHFILRVFLAFTRQATKLGENGIWTVDKIRSESEEFLRRFTIQAYYDYGQDRGGYKLPVMTSDWGHLKSDVEREFRKSPEWHQYEDELLSVAEKIAKGTRRQRTGCENTGTGGTRRAKIDAFISKMTEHGRKISRKDIWAAAGYHDRTEFERFQREDPRINESAVSNFNRILSMSSDEFLALLARYNKK